MADGIEISRADHSIYGFANRWRRTNGRWQRKVISVPKDDSRTIQRFETPAIVIDSDRRKTVVTQKSTTGRDVVDAKNQRVKANDIHAIPLH